jgi:hypothetical protein
MKRILLHLIHADETGECDKIVQGFAALGYRITQIEAAYLWERYSDSVSASWLMWPYRTEEDHDKNIVETLRPWFSEGGEEGKQ